MEMVALQFDTSLGEFFLHTTITNLICIVLYCIDKNLHQTLLELLIIFDGARSQAHGKSISYDENEMVK